MGFWWFMFICSMIIPLTMIIVGRIMQKQWPKTINGISGYRTSRSMKNEDTWRFANTYFGRLWTRFGLIMTVPTIMVQLSLIGCDNDRIGSIGLITDIVQIAVMFVPLIMTERALKREFDEYGIKRKGDIPK